MQSAQSNCSSFYPSQPNYSLMPKENLLKSQENLDKERDALLIILEATQKSLKEIAEQRSKINARLEEIEKSEKIEPIQIASKSQIINEEKLTPEIEKIIECGNSVLIIDTNKIKITHFEDGRPDCESYAISLLSKYGKTQIDKFPIDSKKYGEIKQILISDGETERALKLTDEIFKRLIKYFSTDLNTLRKELDSNYNEYMNIPFDCQRFSYYLYSGKEGEYKTSISETDPFHMGDLSSYYRNDFRTRSPLFTPGSFYKTTATTAAIGNESYKRENNSLHHFVCLDKDLYVSKYGDGDVLFTSYQQLLDAYFPEKFVKGISLGKK